MKCFERMITYAIKGSIIFADMYKKNLNVPIKFDRLFAMGVLQPAKLPLVLLVPI